MATEDPVFMFEAMGVSTGVNLARLMAARESLKAGLPMGWVQKPLSA